jgi:hypothetical protein
VSRYWGHPTAAPTKAGRRWIGAHGSQQTGAHRGHTAAFGTQAAAAGGDAIAILGNAARDSTARARHEETTNRQRRCSGERRAHQKSGERRSTGAARWRGTADKKHARGLGGRDAAGVAEEAQTTVGSAATHARAHCAPRRCGGGASSRPGAAESGLPSHCDRRSVAGASARQGSRGLKLTLGHTAAAENTRGTGAALPRPERAEVWYLATGPPGDGIGPRVRRKPSRHDEKYRLHRARAAGGAPWRLMARKGD